MDQESKLDALQWEISQRPGSAKNWLELIAAVEAASYTTAVDRVNAVSVCYERAVRAVPYSYKLWTRYIRYREGETRALCTSNEGFQSLRELYERALEKLPQMPLLWVAFLRFVADFPVPRVTMVRHIIGKALMALPATQHHHIWKLAKKFAARDGIPVGTVKRIWRLYLLFETSDAAKREYLYLLLRRGNTDDFLAECMEVALHMCSSDTADHTETAADTEAEPGPSRVPLLEDTNFWEPIRVAFQSTGWSFTGDVDRLARLVEVGKRYSASPAEFALHFAVFLYGQGFIERGRNEMLRLLEDATDPDTFALVYHTATEIEDQVVESFALNEEVRLADDATYDKMRCGVFGANATPLTHLQRLVREHGLWLNQSQLRNYPLCVALWLKRVELLSERVFAGEATVTDVVALYRQAIAQCTLGIDQVEGAVGQLYESFVRTLLRHGMSRDVVYVLEEGAWATPFASASTNLDLLGLLVEAKLMTSPTPRDVVVYLEERLTAATTALASPRGQKRPRMGGLLTTATTLSQVRDHPLAWLLALDVCLSHGTIEDLRRLKDAFARSAAYTAETACAMAHQLYRCGHVDEAQREFDRCLTHFRDDSVTVVAVLAQHLTFLVVHFGQRVPLHRVRELARLAEDVASQAMPQAPTATVELLIACAVVETKQGLFGNAARGLQQAATIALRTLRVEHHRGLVEGLVERTIDCTARWRGLGEMREWCGSLVRRVSDPTLLQRVTLHWAALERRSGNVEQARLVLDACGDSQDPASAHGEVYWRLWETLCTDLTEFERVARRRQQAEIRFAKKGSGEAESTSSSSARNGRGS